MPLVFDATPGGANANSYVSVEEASGYFDARRNAEAWGAAVQATRENALTAATQRLEQELYAGLRTSPGVQRLKWPRRDVWDEDDALYAHAVVPRPVKEACAELALYLLAQGATDPFALSGLEGFENVGVGSLDITPRDDAPIAGSLPPQVVRLIRHMLSPSNGVTRLVRG